MPTKVVVVKTYVVMTSEKVSPLMLVYPIPPNPLQKCFPGGVVMRNIELG